MKQPNILMICSDQHAARVTGAYGDRVVSTPNLDALAAAGCRFDSCYCNGPLCVPSRMSFLTGRFPFHSEVTSNGGVLDSRYPTLAHLAVRGGWHAVLAGRMHFMGPDQRHGFLERLVGDVYSYAVYGGANKQPTGESFSDLGNCYLPDPLLHVGPGENPYVEYDRAVTDATAEWLRQYASRDGSPPPFFMLTGFMLPHCPYIAPRPLFDKYYGNVRVPRLSSAELDALHPHHQAYRRSIKLDEMPPAHFDIAAAAYYALVDQLDRNLGDILAALKESGLWENTIVVYFSDHGEMLGNHGRWHKECFFEDAVRVPFIVRHPAGNLVPSVAEHRSLVDLLPTLCEWTGVKPPPGVDGTSLQSVLVGAAPDADRVAKAETYTWEDVGGSTLSSNRMVRKGSWKLCYYGARKTFELFNLADDPEENFNLAAVPAHADTHKELSTLLFADGWTANTGREVEAKLQALGFWENVVEFGGAIRRDTLPSDAPDYWGGAAAARTSVESVSSQADALMPPSRFEVVRFKENPIIHPGMAGLEGPLGENINGPSLIRAPEWLAKPLGRYYLYFAHHRGKYIRLAYADRLEGPWTIYKPGVLDMKNAPGSDHIASPDVHVDNATKEIRIYFHQPPAPGSHYGEQATFVATSPDGLHFTARKEMLGHAYMRVFDYQGYWYGFGMAGIADGVFMRSKDGLTPFEDGPHCLRGVRHSAVWLQGDTLCLLYTLVREAPERIYLATVDLSQDWQAWKPSRPEIILQPAMDYEGVNLPLQPSGNGVAMKPVRQLRDPAIYEEDGKRYLLYSVAGEQGIAIAELKPKAK
ncbi:MAG: sulfatase-like hydrolase/transferase [Lentisphaeria bacterium]|jgi:choline-sulfatase